MKSIDEQIVLDACREFYLLKDYITTLDIKNLLRSKGYYATQKQTSFLIRKLSKDFNWKSYKDDGHIIYLMTENGVVL